MYWNKNKKKYIAVIFGGILILVILCLGDYGIRYYNAPIEKDYKYIGTGMLVHLSDFTNGELVSVEMRGKTAHYIWGNQEDYIQGNVWVNGEKIFGKDDMEIVGLFINAEPYYSCITSTEKNNLGNMFIISKDLQTILCGVTIDEEEFLLVTPAEDGTTANNMIKTAEKQSQAFSQWLSNARRGIKD